MSRIYSVVIIGTGKIAGIRDTPQKTEYPKSHAQAIFNHPYLQLIGAVNPDQIELQQFVKKWRIKHQFTSVDELINSDLEYDIIVITTPNQTHTSILLEIIKNCSKKLVFIEKPLCVTNVELEQLLNLPNTNRIVINHSRRFCDVHQDIFKKIQNQELGNVLGGRFTYYGGWLVNGIHVLDMLMYWFGSNCTIQHKKVMSFGRKNDACIELILNYHSFQIELKTFDENYFQLFEGEFWFKNGRIVYRDFGNDILIEKVQQNHLDEKELKLETRLIGLKAPFRNAYQQLYETVAGDDNDKLCQVEIQQVKNLMQRFFEVSKL